jgi:hypothetical protein
VTLPSKPRITGYHAMIQGADGPSGIHHRVSLDALDLEDAKRQLESRYGIGNVVSLWGDWESTRIRGEAATKLDVQC